MSRIAVIQMTSSRDVEANLEFVRQQCRQACQSGAQLVLTPENTLLFGNKHDYHRIAEPLGDGPIQQAMSVIAQECQLTLVLGSMPIRTDNGVTSTSIAWGPDGEYLAHYDKLHMFDVDVADGHQHYRESDTFIAGQDIVSLETSIAHTGMSICYDVRFPALFQTLRQRGAEVILVPAAFTAVTGRAHWEVLLRARAIETQCWVIAAAQTGHHSSGRDTWGHSMVVDPWGSVTAQLAQSPGLLLADIDLSVGRSIRTSMPLISHGRFEHQLVKTPLTKE